MRKYLLKDKMAQKGMSVYDVADKSDGLLNYTKVYNQLAGRTTPNTDHITGYIIALDLNPQEIFDIFFERDASKMKRI